MRDCGINTFGFKMIATSKCLARLQILDIKGNKVTDVRGVDSKSAIRDRQRTGDMMKL